MLQFLGTGSAFNTALGNTSAWLRRGDAFVLIDCGGTVFDRLLRAGLLKGIRQLDICLTHTHGDHVGSLGDLILYSHYMLGLKPTLHHPDAERIARLTELLGVPQEVCRMDGAMAFEVGQWLKARFGLQKHADTLPAYGLELQLEGREAWYSGDARGIPADILTRFLTGALDVMYQDTCSVERPDGLHLSLEALCRLIPPDMRQRVICMHVDEGFDPAAAAALGFQVAAPAQGI